MKVFLLVYTFPTILHVHVVVLKISILIRILIQFLQLLSLFLVLTHIECFPAKAAGFAHGLTIYIISNWNCILVLNLVCIVVLVVFILVLNFEVFVSS